MLKEEFFIFFLLWINEKKIKKNKFGEDESKFISIIDNVYPVFRFVFFFVAVKFFFVVDEFFQQYYICWITAWSPSHIYKHLLRFLCNKMPCRPIFFFLHFILFNSKALEFFFFLSLQCPAMVFAQIGGAVPNAGAFSFIFPQKSRSHWIIQHIYRIQETMNTVMTHVI